MKEVRTHKDVENGVVEEKVAEVGESIVCSQISGPRNPPYLCSALLRFICFLLGFLFCRQSRTLLVETASCLQIFFIIARGRVCGRVESGKLHVTAPHYSSAAST